MKLKILILILLSLSSCIKEDYDTYKYTIKNESSKNLTIYSYPANYPKNSPIKIFIVNGEKITKEETTKYSYSFLNFFGNENALCDSLKVIYDAEKYQIYKNSFSNDITNPLNLNIYNKITETFIFTQQDYENAQPCNGNCD